MHRLLAALIALLAVSIQSFALENLNPPQIQLERLLADGVWRSGRPVDRPFMFRTADGFAVTAQNCGLEGFFYTKTELEKRFAPEAFSHHFMDYFLYTDYLLSKYPFTAEIRKQLAKAKDSPLTPLEKNAEFNKLLGEYLAGLQKDYRTGEASGWAKTARIYQIFPRAYNIKGRRAALKLSAGELSEKFFRDFSDQDFKAITDMGFDTVWPMGIFPTGETNRSGTAGGSVYSIKDPEAVNPDLGTLEDFKNFVARAHGAGVKVIIDFVANHTSQDSTLLAENPDYFINTPAPADFSGQVPASHFLYEKDGKKYFVRMGSYDCGGETLCTWNDVAQLNYANPQLRPRLAKIITGWLQNADVDGFRVDMAYQDLNSVFGRNFNTAMPDGEFFTGMIASARTVKPSAAFIAEAYDNQAELSAAGFDLFYNKSEWGRLEGQTGWYDAFMHASPSEIIPAINREAFLSWQAGGAGGLAFFINHDEPAAKKVYGNRLPAVAMLTMLLPGAVLMYNGAEIGFDGAVEGESKTIPFSVPVQIAWDKADPEYSARMSDIIMRAKAMHAELGSSVMKALYPPQGEKWCGYVLVPTDPQKTPIAIIANAVNEKLKVDIFAAEYNLRFKGVLEPGAYRIVKLNAKTPEAESGN
ncbi:MAG: alpha-amylase family glycosyl hydrolase [Elusimicrobiaceae bacterium]